MGQVSSSSLGKELKCDDAKSVGQPASKSNLYKLPKVRQPQQYKGKNHYARILSRLDEMRKSDILTDVVIECDNQKFRCHSIALLTRSNYFKYKIMSDFYDPNKTLLEISEDEMRPAVVEDLLNFIYTNSIDIPKDKVQEYVKAASKWQLEDIVSSQKIVLGQYVLRASTSSLFQQIFTEEEMLLPYLNIKSTDVETTVQTKLSVLAQFEQEEGIFPKTNLRLCTMGGGKLSCHRELLASFGEYFHAMFGSLSFCESYKNEVLLQDVDIETLRLLVGYIYTSKITLDYESARNVAVAGRWMLADDDLVNIAETHLINSVTFENCIELSKFAAKYSFENLQTEADNVCYSYLEEVMDTRSFHELSVDHICDYLSSDKLAVESEKLVFEAALNWDQGKHDSSTMERVFQCVRSTLMSSDELHKCKGIRLSLVQNAALQTTIDTTKITSFEPAEIRFHKSKQKLRDCYAMNILVVIPCREPGRNKSTLNIVSVKRNRQQNSESRRNPEEMFGMELCCKVKLNYRTFCNFSVTTFNNQLYITGGQHRPRNFSEHKVALSCMFIFNPAVPHKWFQGPELCHARYSHHMLVVDDRLYAIGGRTGQENFVTTIERFGLDESLWVEETSMHSVTSRTVCAARGNLIYIFTRCDERSFALLRSYDTKQQVWSEAVVLPFNYLLCADPYDMFVMDDMIYLIGNQHTGKDQYQVSRYNPVTKEWLHCFATNGKVGMCTPFVYDGMLVILGNINSPRSNSPRTDSIPGTVAWRPPFSNENLKQTRGLMYKPSWREYKTIIRPHTRYQTSPIYVYTNPRYNQTAKY